MNLAAFVQFIYPALCIHCSQTTGHYRQLLCKECKQNFTLIDPSGRCRRCFSLAEMDSGPCGLCKEYSHPFKGLASAFEHIGPAAALVSELKYKGRFKLAKDLAAFMFVQFCRLDWPVPDMIIPVPQSFSRGMIRGYNQSLLIAEEFGKRIDRSPHNILKRRNSDFSQTGLNRQQRNQLRSDAFGWKKPIDLSDRIVLVIDDVMTTSSTLRRCGAVLQEGFPKGLYGMTFSVS